MHSGELCPKYQPDSRQIAAFRNAVSNQYWFEMYFGSILLLILLLDDLPVWGFIGEIPGHQTQKGGYLLYAHREFTIGYNDNQVF